VILLTYEEMQKSHTDLNIVEMDLSEISGLKGLYYAGNIAIEKNLSSTEKSCVLAEELGHHYTTYGNIMDQKDIQNRKQELRARLYGYDMQIGLIGIIECYKHHCRSLYEMAEYLQVTEEYLQEALECYSRKYGENLVTIDNYAIRFVPSLQVIEFWK
jgi:hypothetical protein